MNFYDTLRNFVSNLGAPGKDKAASAEIVHEPLARATIDAIYRDDAFGRKAVDIPAFDMTRAWRGWQAEKDQITRLEAEERRLNVRGKVKEAKTLARLYGGAVIVMHDGASSLGRALNIRGAGGLKTIMVLNRYRIRPGDIQWDPTADGFDEPEWWEFTTGGARGDDYRIHPSRVVRFIGNPIPNTDEAGSSEDRIWGDSIYQTIRTNVLQAAATNAAVAALVEEAKTDVVKVPGFMAQIATAEYRKALQERVELAAILKSIVNTTIIDGEEEWERKQISFQNIPELQAQAMQLLAGAVDIPAPRFLSQSPGGLNSTGESDLRNYYDRLSAEQEVELQPTLTPLDNAVIISALGTRPETVRYDWRPLWQLSAKEQAEVENSRATAAKTLAESRMVPLAALAKGVQNKLIEDGTYPGLEEAIREAEAGTLLPFEEPVGPDGLPVGGPRPAAAGKPGAGKTEAKTPSAANENHEITVNGPGGLSIKAKVKKRDGLIRDAAPRSLYISRRLLNAQQFQRWALAQGFTSTLPQAQMHVTVAYSRTPVDWMKVGQDWWGTDETGRLRIPAGGPRSIERFGDAIVLEFASDSLRYRHDRVKDVGGSHDFPEYRPHVTITYEAPPGLDLSKVEPFRGSLLFGPEIFEEIDEELP